MPGERLKPISTKCLSLGIAALSRGSVRKFCGFVRAERARKNPRKPPEMLVCKNVRRFSKYGCKPERRSSGAQPHNAPPKKKISTPLQYLKKRLTFIHLYFQTNKQWKNKDFFFRKSAPPKNSLTSAHTPLTNIALPLDSPPIFDDKHSVLIAQPAAPAGFFVPERPNLTWSSCSVILGTREQGAPAMHVGQLVTPAKSPYRQAIRDHGYLWVATNFTHRLPDEPVPCTSLATGKRLYFLARYLTHAEG